MVSNRSEERLPSSDTIATAELTSEFTPQSSVGEKVDFDDIHPTDDSKSTTSSTIADFSSMLVLQIDSKFTSECDDEFKSKSLSNEASPKSTFPTFIDAGYESLDPDNLRNIVLTKFISDIVLNILQQGLIK
jgi:hypothetical protein